MLYDHIYVVPTSGIRTCEDDVGLFRVEGKRRPAAHLCLFENVPQIANQAETQRRTSQPSFLPPAPPLARCALRRMDSWPRPRVAIPIRKKEFARDRALPFFVDVDLDQRSDCI